MTKGTDPLGIKAWISPLGKDPRLVEVLADGGRKWRLVKEGSYKY